MTPEARGDDFARPRDIEQVLREMRAWAVVGCSSNPMRPSHGVSRTLLSYGYEVIPVNPREATVLGLEAYPDLASASAATHARGGQIEVVDIFRRSSQAGIHVDEAIAVGAKAVWMQLGVIDEAAAQRARAAGLLVIMDRCPAIELPRLHPPPRRPRH
jgi:predicted CoA-binding protein